VVELDREYLPRLGSIIVRYDAAPNPTREAEAIAMYEVACRQRDQLRCLLVKIALRVATEQQAAG